MHILLLPASVMDGRLIVNFMIIGWGQKENVNGRDIGSWIITVIGISILRVL
jgi:hypothetical protein